MRTTYIRSSSYSNFDFCQMQYFLTYVLGLDRKAGKKADKGTATHKVLECLALIQKAYQDTGKYEIQDEVLGLITCAPDDYLFPTTLSDSDVEYINSTRQNKYTYLEPCNIKHGHTRYGVELVEDLIRRSYAYYESKSTDKWTAVDFKDVTNFVWMVLDYKNGQFDPRRRNIVAAEPHFDFIIDKAWAEYDWTTSDGKRIVGKLGIKGTVDLITRIDDTTIEVVDWKTGQRKNWATGEVKDYPALCKDIQLMLYHYAVRKMYPDVKQVMVSIFFVRNGGPFTVCFEDEHLDVIEEKLRERFLEIKMCDKPKMCDPTQRDFKCSKLCDFYKNSLQEGQPNTCRFIHDTILEKGIDYVTDTYTNPKFSIHNYQAPGGAE